MGIKTVKRLAILMGVIALVGVGGYFLWQLQVERMARGVVARAEEAEQRGDFAKAVELYRGHLAVVPDDTDVQLKYANAILKLDGSQRRAREALEIYEDIVRRFPGRDDVRRLAAERIVDLGGVGSEKLRGHLKILLGKVKDDGHLEYLMGRCDEQENEFARAAEYYRAAIEHGAPERLEAAQRLAMLLRDKDKLDKPAEADRVIDAMVKSAPDDYRVYLGRGRYYEHPGKPGGGEDFRKAGDDFRKALEKAPDKPEVYLEVARAAERESGLDAARDVLDKGLAALPKAVELYLALSNLEQRAGRAGGATDALELGLKEMPDQLMLRQQLALLLANQGDTGKLNLQIAELERLGTSTLYTRYLKAYYHYNKQEFVQARRILTPLLPDTTPVPALKAMVNVLLARCYAEQNEPELQRDAMLRALSSNPNDLYARLSWIQGLINRGELDEAIKEYRALKDQQPGAVRLPLASLLIERNRLQPAAQPPWAEAKQLIDAAAAASPGAVEPWLVRAQLLQAQGHDADAFDAVKTARGKFPKNPGPWLAEVAMLTRQKKFDEAQEVLDGARQLLGDRVDLRLARAQLAVARGGAQVLPTLNKQLEGIEHFSREDRRKLLTAVAFELGRQQDLAGAARAWSRLAEEEPEGLGPHLQLFELALQTGQEKEAEGRIGVIEKLDEQFGQFCRAQFLAWKAQNAEVAARDKLRTEARGLLIGLKVRRPDWARIPLAMARLDEQELEQAGPDEARKREKLESSINSYRRAIELGLRDPVVVRHVVQLLFRAGRGSEALEVYSQVPASGQLVGDLGRMASQIALANRDYHQAEEIARKAVVASPDDFQARVWLVRLLLEGRRNDEAKAELRAAVDAAKGDPDRWITLVRFLVLIRQPGPAEEATREAEAHLVKASLAPARASLALAECCQIVGSAYSDAEPDRAKSWFDQARRWFGKARAEVKDPDDLSVERRIAAFFLRTNQLADAEGSLKEILARTAGGKSPDLAALARRSLAQVYAFANPPRIAEALALFGDAARGVRVDDPDDLRVLAMVHEAQGTPAGRRQAVSDLELLIDRTSAVPEDRRRLAQLLEVTGDWPRAREQYRELILRTEGVGFPETMARRPRYLALFIEALTRHHQPGDDSDLAEARQLVEKLKPFVRDAAGAILLEAQIDIAANQIGAATDRLLKFAARPGQTVAIRATLANAAERLGLLGAAETICRGIAAEPPANPNRFPLISFLSRHGRMKDAVDLCESLWADAALRERVAGLCGQILSNPNIPFDEVQAKRVIDWIERARPEKPQSMMYLLALGALYERLGNYPKAVEVYRTAISNDRDGTASNNLAWLLALKGGSGSEALDLINNAIRIKGQVPEFLDTRGMIYLSDGDAQHAIADLEKALQAAPNDGPKYFHLAQAYLKVKDLEKARKFWQVGKARGLPGGLHPLEQAVYNQVASQLGTP
jgi:tetratricopeptide (TPR) repeat protein